MSTHAAGPAESARPDRWTERILRIRELGILAALALLIAVTAILEPRFIEADSLRNLALNASILAILAVGQTLVIITRNVDLSTGSVLGLSAFLAGDLLSKHPGMALPVVFLLGIALGAACGLFNGVLVTWGQVPALVVTLGTLYAFRGLAFLWTDGRQVNAETLPDSFLNIGSESIAGVPILVLIAVVMVMVPRPCHGGTQMARSIGRQARSCPLLPLKRVSAINRPVQTAWLANGHARAVFYCIERIAKCPR